LIEGVIFVSPCPGNQAGRSITFSAFRSRTFPKVPLWVDAVLWLGLIKDTAARFEYGTCEECDLAAEEFSHKH
jgi:hypothetical protein